jgi:hypothetical protein
MEMVMFGIGFIALAAASLRWAADSRPGFGDGWTDSRKRWYPGSSAHVVDVFADRPGA